MLCVYRRAAGAVRSANEVARSVSTMVRAISSWIANTSASVRSYRSDQSSWPSSVDVSWAEIRRRSPARRTVPSSTQAAPSRAPMARTSCGFPLSANTDVRDATRSPSTPARAAISSSVMPSLRYSFSGSGLALTNGSTAMQRTAAEAITPDPASAPSPCRAARNSATVANRSSGFLASARASTRSTRAGASGLTARSGRGVSVTCFAMVARAPPPRSGGSPASIS